MQYFKMYEWDLLLFCKQTSLKLAAIGTLKVHNHGLYGICN